MDPERAGYDQPPAYDQVKQPNVVPPTADPSFQGLRAGVPVQGFNQGMTHMQSNTVVITSQPVPMNRVILMDRPSDYMIASIFACLCCFWPTGAFAIYFASESRRCADVGDMENARIMSNRARNLIIASVILGVICIAIYVALKVTASQIN